MGKKVMKLASREKRLGAYVIDQIVPLIFSIVIVAAISSIAAFNYFAGDFGYGMSSGIASIIAIVLSILFFLAYLGVEIYFYTKSTTIGKAILNMQVIDANDGNPVGFWKMLVREWLAKKASSIVFYLGYIWILIDDKNRGWHDKIMDTYVVDLKQSELLNNNLMANTEVQPEIQASEEVQIETETPHETTHEAADSSLEINSSLKKDELLKIAETRGIKISSKATKAEIIEALNK